MISNLSDDRLILSLSHAPLPTPLLDELVEQTSAECTSMFNTIEEIRKEKKGDQSLDKRNSILHVLATGTPYVIKPGKSQPDYIHQWTKGEKILARLVDKIGMEMFHRVPRDGGTKLAGRLIDVKPSDFEFILTHGQNQSKKKGTSGENNKENSINYEHTSPEQNNTKDSYWRDDCLLEELSWIANNILRILIIDKRPKIGHTKILFPVDPRFQHVNRNELLQFVKSVFSKEWTQKDGPLKGSDVEVIIVQRE